MSGDIIDISVNTCHLVDDSPVYRVHDDSPISAQPVKAQKHMTRCYGVKNPHKLKAAHIVCCYGDDFLKKAHIFIKWNHIVAETCQNIQDVTKQINSKKMHQFVFLQWLSSLPPIA